MLKKILLLFFFLLVFNFAYAEQIFVTLSHIDTKLLMDGKWSFEKEWSNTSEDVVRFDDGTKFSIRTGHNYENIYVLIDFVSDTSIEKLADRGIICIDSMNDKEDRPSSNDFCFFVTIGSKYPITLQGGSPLAHTGFFNKINNHAELQAAGGISSTHDRYSKIPHASYEFKIPIEIFGKSDVYGFYVGVFDAKDGKQYSWPQHSATEKYPFIPPPNQWGELVSPDKSIPELGLPFFALSLALFFVVYWTKKNPIKKHIN